MKQQQMAYSALLATAFLLGSVYALGADSHRQIQGLLDSKGNAYVRLRDAAVAEQPATEEGTTAATPEAHLLRRILRERKEHPDAFTRYPDLVLEDRQRLESLPAADLGLVTNSAAGFAPLAHAISQALNRKGITAQERGLIALAVQEHFWKLSENEYEQYNTLVAMAGLARIGLLDTAISNEVVRVAQSADSPRVAGAALELLDLMNRPVSPDLIAAVWTKHRTSVQVGRTCGALLNAQQGNLKAMEVLKTIDAERERQIERAATNRNAPGKRILTTDGDTPDPIQPLDR